MQNLFQDEENLFLTKFQVLRFLQDVQINSYNLYGLINGQCATHNPTNLNMCRTYLFSAIVSTERRFKTSMVKKYATDISSKSYYI